MKALFAVDDDDRYEDVLRASEWCLAVGAEDEILLAHVVPTLRWAPLRSGSAPGWAGTERAIFEKVDDFLAGTVKRLAESGLRATALRLEGDAGTEIVRAAGEHGVDVIVLGAYGQSRTQDFLVGSVAEKVHALAERDVLLVRSTPDGSSERFRAVLAVDGSAASLEAVEAFATNLRADRAEIRVVHVLELPPATWGVGLVGEAEGGSSVPRPVSERAQAAVRGALAILERHGLKAESLIRRGSEAGEILAEAGEAALVVLASRGAAARSPRDPVGTVAKRVVRHAGCSVFLAFPRGRLEESS